MTSLPPDPYKALGVSKEAQIAEIRTAYRKLVLKCHPDKVQDPALKAQKAEEFQKVQQAYELLNNEKERQRYDDQVRLLELREQMKAAKASTPRAAPTYKYDIRNVEIRTAEPRPSTFKSSSPPTKGYESFSRSYESSPRSFEEVRTPPRRESSYSEKPSKSERERERERERRDKEKDRERRKKEKAEDAARRAEKEAKEAKRAEKKAREKAEEKERRRNGEDKKRHTAPYIEGYEDEPPKSEKKRSSKKHDDKRDRSLHREEVPPMPAPPVPPMPPQERSYTEKEEYAASYIEAAKKKNPAYRSAVAPPAPTPPPVAGQSSPFSPPPVVEEPDVHRSTKSRRGSSGEKSSYKKSSREVLNDPDIVNASPSARYAQKSATAATMGSSPPRLGRQNTAPAEYASRPIPTMARATTFSGYAEDPRGRGRSRLQPQVEESESDEDYERRHRKHRSSKKHRSPGPEPRSAEHVNKYKVSDGRATLHSSYSRSLEPEPADYYHYTAAPGIHVVESRPAMPDRDASYSRSAASSYPKYKTSRSYDYGDVVYSQYPAHTYPDEYSAAFA